MEAIQREVFLKIYNQENIEEIISVFSSIASNISINIPGVNVKAGNIKEFYDKLKSIIISSKTKENMLKGRIISFDDFERKSSKVDLNDLFGFITHLALEFKCKIVIILNKEFIESKDAETFSRVKEKTVNKFISFEPTIDELFEIIYKSNKKYEYFNGSAKEEILKSIKEADELNARIYFQILDNCLEYSESKKGANSLQLRTLAIATIIFTKYDKIFNPSYRKAEEDQKLDIEEFSNLTEFTRTIFTLIMRRYTFTNEDDLYEKMKDFLSRKSLPDKVTSEYEISDGKIDLHYVTIEENKKLLWLIYFYVYKMDFRKNITDEDLKGINDFVKNGIIEKKQ